MTILKFKYAKRFVKVVQKNDHHFKTLFLFNLIIIIIVCRVQLLALP